jgi:WS/DGAT/MGAT family acyltransferase
VADTVAAGPAPGRPPVARRILVVSALRAAGADDAATRSVVEQVRRRWPGSETRTVTVPRHGAGRAGRRLVPVIERFDPDLVVPADPVAAAAVDRLRRRGLGVPVGLEPTPPGQPATARPWPMRAQDAIFWYIDTPTVPQHIGAVLHLGPRPDGRPLSRADLVDLLRQRLPALTLLHRVPVRRGARRAGWRYVEPDPDHHVDERRLPSAAGIAAAVDEFWSEPLPPGRPPWHMRLVTGAPDGGTVLAAKLHHCLGDGLSVIGTLARLLDPVPSGSGEDAYPPSGSGNGDLRPGRPGDAPRDGPAGRWADGTAARRRRPWRTLRGLVLLAVSRRAPRTAINRPLVTPRRRMVATTLPAAEVGRVARELRAHPSELTCALVAEALHRVWPGPGPAPPVLRAMFAVSSRAARRASTQGNWTGAVALDLPTGPLPLPDRVALVRDRLRRGLRSGQPAAAELVLRTLGRLPGWLHAAIARRIYGSRHMNVIVSYLAGPLRPYALAGSPIRTVAPVVGLAPGVPVGVGILRWADHVGIGVLLDDALADLGDALVAALRDAFDRLAAPADGPSVPADRDAAGDGGPAGAGRPATRGWEAPPYGWETRPCRRETGPFRRGTRPYGGRRRPRGHVDRKVPGRGREPARRTVGWATMGTLKQRLADDMRQAMRDRDETTMGTLRMALAAVKSEEVAGKAARELSDDEVVAVLRREAKKRREAAEAYQRGGRPDLAERELAEERVLTRYLPAQLSDEELADLVRRVLTEQGLSGVKAMGPAMKAVQPVVAGRADGARVAAEVRRQLSELGG